MLGTKPAALQVVPLQAVLELLELDIIKSITVMDMNAAGVRNTTYHISD